MSIFDGLNNEFQLWNKHQLDDHKTSTIFAHIFCNGFRKYIEAPAYYKLPLLDDAAGGMEYPYVTAKKLVGLRDDSYKTEDQEHAFGLLSKDDDRYWQFAMVVTFELAPDAFPKQAYAVPLFFTIADGRCTLRIMKRSDGEFQVTINDINSYRPAYDFIVKLFSENFRLKPSDRVRERPTIGFIELPSESPGELSIVWHAKRQTQPPPPRR